MSRPRLYLIVLVVTGALFWTWFFDVRAFNFDVWDWEKEVAYFDVWQQALRSLTFPFHVSREIHQTDRFLAIPETRMLPHVLLLAVLPIRAFVVVDVLALFIVGAYGCRRLCERLLMSPAAAALFATLFLFNGYIQSHLGVGHSMWLAYFLCPWIATAFFAWQEEPVGSARGLAMPMAVALYAGGVHLVVWWWMFLAVLAVVPPRRAHGVALLQALGWFVALGAFRLVPAAITYTGGGYTFLGGFPSMRDMVTTFFVLHDSTWKVSEVLGWWEFDYYLGPLGAAILLFALVQAARRRQASLLAATTLMVVWAHTVNYRFVTKLPLPLVNSERTTSRFLTVPFVLLLALGVRDLPRRFLVPTTIVSAALLVWHATLWRLPALQGVWHHEPPSPIAIAERPDPGYVAALGASALVSCIAAYIAWKRGAKRGLLSA